MELFC